MGPTPPDNSNKPRCRNCRSTAVIIDWTGHISVCVACKEDHRLPPDFKKRRKESKCECGAEKTYKDCKAHFHSDWCPKYREKKDE